MFARVRSLDRIGSAGDCEDADPERASSLVQRQGRGDCGGVGGRDGDDQGAGRAREGLVLELRVVGNRGLVDVEGDRELRGRACSDALAALQILGFRVVAAPLRLRPDRGRLVHDERLGAGADVLQVSRVGTAVVVSADGLDEVRDAERALRADPRQSHPRVPDRDRRLGHRLGRRQRASSCPRRPRPTSPAARRAPPARVPGSRFRCHLPYARILTPGRSSVVSIAPWPGTSTLPARSTATGASRSPPALSRPASTSRSLARHRPRRLGRRRRRDPRRRGRCFLEGPQGRGRQRDPHPDPDSCRRCRRRSLRGEVQAVERRVRRGIRRRSRQADRHAASPRSRPRAEGDRPRRDGDRVLARTGRRDPALRVRGRAGALVGGRPSAASLALPEGCRSG